MVQKHKKGRKMMSDRRNQPLVITNGDKNIVGSKFVSLSEKIPELNGDINVTSEMLLYSMKTVMGKEKDNQVWREKMI